MGKGKSFIMQVFTILLMIIFTSCKIEPPVEGPVMGAERFDHYIHDLEDKNVALVVNHTSLVADTHLLDVLLSRGIKITKIFAPEHGFRGKADAGEMIKDGVDNKTGVSVVSLYGDNKKPRSDQMEGLDIVVFDIQDVGVRFYTYISTMTYAMEACAENDVEFLVLDRPNPNGNYVDGPVLDMTFKSFVGMHPIPVVHGMTIGELAQMINEEGWLEEGKKCKLKVVNVENWDHKTRFDLPVKPSPNLPNQQSVRLYPTVCLFEGTMMSLGRGTEFPFQVAGYPDPTLGDFSFTPTSRPGATKPKYMDEKCYGVDLRKADPDIGFTLKYLIEFYRKVVDKDSYFNAYFKKLAGTEELQEQITSGKTEEEIRNSWQEGLKHFKSKRRKYLLYPDFE